ncbi:MAG: hypothetical protein ACR2RV_20090 [Verrucomicrobiales bacterium]
MFSQKEFLEVSRNFVCVRLDTYENNEHQRMVADLLGGKERNTAFVALAPDGKTHLSEAGRSPRSLGGKRGVLPGLRRIGDSYEPKAKVGNAVLQDLHSLKQALRTGAADQRLLVCLAMPAGSTIVEEKLMREVFNDEDVRGRVHFDVLGEEDHETWTKVGEGTTEPGFYVVRPGTYGLTGKIIATIPLGSSAGELETAVLKANREHAASEKRKDHTEHVTAGNAAGMTRSKRRR